LGGVEIAPADGVFVIVRSSKSRRGISGRRQSEEIGFQQLLSSSSTGPAASFSARPLLYEKYNPPNYEKNRSDYQTIQA
jgi:hypothetical protein